MTVGGMLRTVVADGWFWLLVGIEGFCEISSRLDEFVEFMLCGAALITPFIPALELEFTLMLKFFVAPEPE